MKFRLIFLAAFVLLASCEKPAVPPTPVEPEKPTLPSDAYIQAKGDVKVLTDPGSIITIDVQSNTDWDFELSEESFVEKERTKNSLVLALDKLSYTEDRNIEIKLFCVPIASSTNKSVLSTKSSDVPSQVVKVKVRCALSLDVEFQKDGSAKDISPNKLVVNKIDGVSSVVYYNESAKRNAVRFFSDAGSIATEGFYKIDYASSKTLKDALSDGHSIEVQFSLGRKITNTGEVKMFSSMDAGGTGFLLTSKQMGGDIAFLPNVSTDGKSNWCWARSSVIPKVGEFYHVVGVWDKAEGKARVYVNGELKGAAKAEGEFNFPASALARWFCIGGDSTPGSNAECTWNGDVIRAKIYDAALRDSDVSELYQNANFAYTPSQIDVQNIVYLPVCTLKPGSQYTIAGTGFKKGDALRFSSLSRDYTTDVVAECLEDRIRVELPIELASDKYSLSVLRNGQSAAIGVCELNFSQNAEPLSPVKVVAHRGFHKNCTENSIASLLAAQKAGMDAAEIDIWITTDGQLLVNHDGVANGKKIQDYPSSEFPNVPRLSEFLELLPSNPQTKLIIEVKEHSSKQRNTQCTQAMIDMVKSMGMQSYVEFISFDLDICAQIAAAIDGAMVGYLSSTSDLQGLKNKGIMCADFSYSYLFMNPSLIEEAHKLGMKVNIWTINAQFDLTKAIGLGVDYITTDIPDDLQTIQSRLF